MNGRRRFERQLRQSPERAANVEVNGIDVVPHAELRRSVSQGGLHNAGRDAGLREQRAVRVPQRMDADCSPAIVSLRDPREADVAVEGLDRVRGDAEEKTLAPSSDPSAQVVREILAQRDYRPASRLLVLRVEDDVGALVVDDDIPYESTIRALGYLAAQ